MNEFNVDFHIHSRFSGGTSDKMVLPLIAEHAAEKGLHLVGTGDATHPGWIKHMRDNLSESSAGTYSIKGSETKFLVTAEIEDARRVHHVILLPSISAAENFSKNIGKHSVNIASDGRPNVRLDGAEIVDAASEVGALVGPAHAFTPWTAVYKEYGSLAECYQDNLGKVKFLELGLSADSDMADRIEELSDVVFLSNSDCHSPQPHRLGREFNRLKLKELSFPEIVKALERSGGRKFTLNVGLNPLEGKYHVTACSRCYLKFTPQDALSLKRRCPECKGIIKRGVTDRIDELATWDVAHHPKHRPPYVRILPLAEVISLALGVSTLTSKRIQDKWRMLVDEFETEINVLVDADIVEVKRFDPKVGAVIEKFRAGRIRYVAGGGGKYGKPTLSGEKDEYWGIGQKKIGDY
ncbi:MAG: TIGR00375 family protein [Candidatus Altiarchaeota archaeon]